MSRSIHGRKLRIENNARHNGGPSRQRRRHQDYTVACICALPLEMAAVAAMLDERHESLPAKSSDTNSYILGRIGHHCVAIACLPAGVYGTTAATNVATQMLSTFDSIRFGLMIGIGGGVPSGSNDIRLGDVVVSKPTRDTGGVIQYDYGKTVAGGRFELTGTLNKPPSVLLTAIARLQAEHKLEPSRIPQILSDAIAKYPATKNDLTYCGPESDRLFASNYDHPVSDSDSDDCRHCDTARLISRVTRDDHNPVIHYGLIASGNQVMKHGQRRDQLAGDLGVLCFEMEAAGLMDNFPCLVIRGICDYCDSHKNKKWQNYAAGTAAAYGKEILSVIPPSQVNDAMLAEEGRDIQKIIDLVSDYDHERMHQRLSRKRLIGTTRWIFDHPHFKQWFNEKTANSLWCSGIIGSGKTMIASAVIDAAKYDLKTPTAFFYCIEDIPVSLDSITILSSLVKQLCGYLLNKDFTLPDNIARDLYRFFGPKRVKPDFDDMAELFNNCYRPFEEVILVVDGIDALGREHAMPLLKVLRLCLVKFGTRSKSRIMLLSRDQVPGFINIDTIMPGILHITTSLNVTQDIKTYIESSVEDKMLYRRLTDDPLLLKEVRQRLLEESSGMFLWVFLQIEILWDTCFTDADIRSTIADLPKDLEDTYGRCLSRIDRGDSRVLKVLKWVSFASNPLHIDELREVIGFSIDDAKWTPAKKPLDLFVVGCCANLVVVEPTDGLVRFAHFSVKQYLDKARNQKLIEGYPTHAQGVIECGETCVAYLSLPNFNLQIASRCEESVVITPPILFARDAIYKSIASRFFPKSQREMRRVSLPLRSVRSTSRPDEDEYNFLCYAIKNWTTQTRDLQPDSPVWGKFVRLATRTDETWNFHPWVSGGQSQASRYHGLFSWAVIEQHAPLLSIAMSATSYMKAICDLPLIGKGIPALHVAVKLRNVSIVQKLLEVCNPNQRDADGLVALHHVALNGDVECCRALLARRDLDINAVSKSNGSPLWLALSQDHEQIIQLLMESGARMGRREECIHNMPLLFAIADGNVQLSLQLIGNGANIEARWGNHHSTYWRNTRDPYWVDRFLMTPLCLATQLRSDVIVKALLDKGAVIEARGLNGLSPLLLAVEDGNEALVRVLLARGAQFMVPKVDTSAEGTKKNRYLTTKKPGSFHSPLLIATEKGHEAVVQLLVSQGADLETTDNRGWTPLHLATHNGHRSLVSLLLTLGANLEAETEHGWTPLYIATGRGDQSLVSMLLKRGANIHVTGSSVMSPFLLAIKQGHEGIMRVFLEEDADLATQTSLEHGHPLLTAVKNGHRPIVSLLLERGASIEAKDTSGRTPLLVATAHGNLSIVRLLLDNGADIHAATSSAFDTTGENSLHIATKGGNKTLVKILLENGANTHATTSSAPEREKLLLIAVEVGNIHVVKALLEIGVDIEVSDTNGENSLHIATRNGNRALVRLLLDNGADITATASSCLDSIAISNQYGNEELVNVLLEKHYDALYKTPFKREKLFLTAVENGNVPFARLLIERGVNIEAFDTNGENSLHIATRNGNKALVRMLLDEGADVRATTSSGLTPISIANLQKHDEITRALRERLYQ
ncbi:Nucleoside phosphorylase and ankyrin repeat domain-containing protein [Penicillium ucsense]|uniref:Nucleoside phosphorylase and ankyrin repeat domain-containing protein n=1 Tax=Penicillium ucsense TaxID=2839758 RepID=A0A8J8WEH4_9EURO|nr:Nucleoside phosphorylase and ankyrin repeat domain-containing protein [Penicillium ucsense]KAF7737561.1 Nucleoside phosphorylase and ankyrin repeat domain-containing protein [Penicillium ucsense]